MATATLRQQGDLDGLTLAYEVHGDSGRPWVITPGGRFTKDDPGIRELTAKVLSRIGYVVLTASGGDEARMICDGYVGAIHLLLSDVVMPGMSGPEVAAMLTAVRPSLKTIYMSGYTDDAVLRHGVMKGMAFLQKPFTPDTLRNKIVEVLTVSDT